MSDKEAIEALSAVEDCFERVTGPWGFKEMNENMDRPLNSSADTLLNNAQTDLNGGKTKWRGEAGLYKGEYERSVLRAKAELPNIKAGTGESMEKGYSGNIDYKLGKGYSGNIDYALGKGYSGNIDYALGKGYSGNIDYALGKAELDMGVWKVEGSFPSASGAFQATTHGAKVMLKAEVISASASFGPVKWTVRQAVDTGFEVGKDGVTVQVLGTGVSVKDGNVGLSLFGSKLEFNLW